MNAFEFAVLCGLRSVQLQDGCSPRVERREKVAITAQHEVAERKVLALPRAVNGVVPVAD